MSCFSGRAVVYCNVTVMQEDNFTWSEAFHYIFKGHGGNIFFAMLFYLLAAIPFWANPILIARMIDLTTAEPGTRLQPFLVYMGLMSASIIFNYPMAMLLVRFTSRISRTVGQSLRIQICRQLQQLTILYHGRQNIGPLQAKAIRDIELIEVLPGIITHNVFQVVIVMIAALIAIALRAPSALWFFIILLGIAVLLRRMFSQKFRQVFHDYRSSLETMSSGLSDMLTMIPVTRAHGLEEFEIENVSSKIKKVMHRGRQMDIISMRFGAGSYVMITLTYALFLGSSVAACIKGMLTIGDVVMFSAFFMRLSGGISGLLHTIPELSKTKESILSIREVLNAPDLEENEGKTVVETVKGAFEFKDVTFFYPETDEAGVRNINLTVAAGQAVAMVGPSGCGKSTTMNLILGFVRPASGVILLDGKDMEELDLRSYRQQVGVVTQDTVFFSGTVKENIAYGMPGIDDSRVTWALTQAQALEFVNDLPEGIQTRIGADGVNLSGGQRQRLSIARAFIRDPKVLVFDEATSALDVETEYILQETMQELMKGRTSFIVSHRLSTIRNANRIIVMDKGRIVKDSEHTELLKSDNYYSRAVKLQVVV